MILSTDNCPDVIKHLLHMAMIMFCHPERGRKVSRNRRENGSKQLTLEGLALVKVKQL